MEPSSALAATDPDRVTIQYFENGGSNPQKERIAIVNIFSVGILIFGIDTWRRRC